MNYHKVLWILFIGLLITYFIVSKIKNKKLNALLWSLMILIQFGQIILPRHFFGKWNSISILNDKNITEIHLHPSQPNWKVNLVEKDFLISNKKVIDSLMKLLKNVEVYSPEHPSRIWETKLVFISSQKDSFEIKINQTENNGTIIYTPTNEWRKYEIGNYLAKLTSYIKPVYCDTSNLRF